MVKAMVQRKKGAWKEILGARDNVANERCMEACKKEKSKEERERGAEDETSYLNQGN